MSETVQDGASVGPSAGDERAASDAMRARLDELSRAYAELLNAREAFKRRLERERDRQLEAQRGEIASALLDTQDELEHALRESAEASGSGLAIGLRLVAENLGRRLEGLGLVRIPAVGHLFDPSLHEGLDLVPTPEAEADGRITGELRAGFRLGERVIRPARVRVARYVPAQGPMPPAGPPTPPPAAGPAPDVRGSESGE